MSSLLSGDIICLVGRSCLSGEALLLLSHHHKRLRMTLRNARAARVEGGRVNHSCFMGLVIDGCGGLGGGRNGGSGW